MYSYPGYANTYGVYDVTGTKANAGYSTFILIIVLFILLIIVGVALC